MISSDVAERIRQLKEEPGQDIVQYGFGAVSTLLMEHGLLDELRLWIHPLFVGKGSTVVVILSALNRLIDMDCHPFFVFGKRRVRLLEIAEFPRFVRRTRCVGEERPEFGCFGAVLLRSEHLTPLSTAGGSTTGLLLAGAVGCTDWSILDAYGDDLAD